MMEHIAKLFETTKTRPSVLILCKCSLYYWGHYCLYLFCIAGRRNEARLTKSMNIASSSPVGDGDQNRQEVPECPNGDDCDKKEDKEPPSEADKQKKDDEVETVSLARCMPATESPPPTIVKEMEEI